MAFLDQWGKLADSFGWSPGDLFDVPRDGRSGLAWWLQGENHRWGSGGGGDSEATVGEDAVRNVASIFF